MELTPRPGSDCDGKLVFEGAPADLVAARKTLTKHLAAYVGG